MKIGIISDSHGDRRAIEKAVRHMIKVDVIFHLGDYIRDGEYIKKIYPGQVYIVRGNCDFFSDAKTPLEQGIVLNDKRVLAVHGHRYNVKDGIKALYYRGLEVNADIVLFGHTHCAGIVKTEEMFFLNPGSVSCPRDSKPPTYGLIEINGGTIRPSIIDF